MAFEVEQPPHDINSLANYVRRMFDRVATQFRQVDNVRLPELHVEPAKPRTGMIVLADGTDWDPGSGAGFYGYRGGAWHLLG
jgi:hypothetical protein